MAEPRLTGGDVAVDRLMPGLATVASALNANDACLARIAAVHLRLPDLPSEAARADMEAADVAIKSADRNPVCIRAFAKLDPDDPRHPGWPAGTEGGRGGKFRPKKSSELAQKVKSRIARRALRTGLLAALRIVGEVAANVIPAFEVAADVAMVTEIVSHSVRIQETRH